MLDELLPRLPQIPDLEAYPLPAGLSGLYRAFLKRELGTEDKGRRWHQTYKPLLGLIAVAQGEGLAAAQLGALIGQAVAEPLDACKQYLTGELPDGPFRPFHKSFADFLLEDEDNLHYHIDAMSMHWRIVRFFLDKCRANWESGSSRYALRYLPSHLLKIAAHRHAGTDSPVQALRDLLSDFDFAYTKIRLIGIDELLEDLRAGQSVIAPGAPATPTALMSVLGPEARSLRWWGQNAHLVDHYPNFLAQQVYNRALQLKAYALATKAKSKLDQFAEGHLVLRWRAGEMESRLTALTVSHDGRYVALAHADATVELLDVKSGESARRFPVPGKSVIMLNASRNGGLISGTSDGEFTFWEPDTWRAIRKVALPGKHELRAARVTADGARAIAVTESNEISLWNLATRDRVRVLGESLSVRDVALSDDGRYAMAGGLAGVPKLWYLELDGPARQLDMPALATEERRGIFGKFLDWTVRLAVGRTAVTISRGSDRAMSVHLGSALNSTMILWDLESGKPVRQIPCPKQTVQSVRLSDDGRLAVVAGATSTMCGAIQVFDTETGNTVALASVDAAAVRLAISSEGRDLVVQDILGGLYCLHLVGSPQVDARRGT